MTLDLAWMQRWMSEAHTTLAQQREYLMELDREIGDGDHGDNIERGFAHVVDALQKDRPDTLREAFTLTAKMLLTHIGGAAGPLLGTAFVRASASINAEELSASDFYSLLVALRDGVQARGRAAIGDKTVVDTLEAACFEAQKEMLNTTDPKLIVEAAAAGAERGAASTENMIAQRGRASYLGDRSVGHLDPGAVSMAMILRAAAQATEQ